LSPVVTGVIGILHLLALGKTVEAANAVLTSRGLQPWALVVYPRRAVRGVDREVDEGREEKKETSDQIIRIVSDGLNDPLSSVLSRSVKSTN